MGWTSYHATHYKNGRVDRKAECDAYFLEGLNKGHYEVLKSCLKGTVYYAAVRPLMKYEKGVYTQLSLEERVVFAAIFLTSIDNNDYYNFSYKEMDESMGPYNYDCPDSILSLLSPTDSKLANERRRKCIEQAKKPNISKLPVGTIIRFLMGNEEVKCIKHEPSYQFKTAFWMCLDGNTYIKKKHIPNDFEIVKLGGSYE